MAMLTVLKIIGIVLACIIGLVLLLICLVLFVPVRCGTVDLQIRYPTLAQQPVG